MGGHGSWSAFLLVMYPWNLSSLQRRLLAANLRYDLDRIKTLAYLRPLEISHPASPDFNFQSVNIPTACQLYIKAPQLPLEKEKDMV
jgi:hypothetical protein